MVAYDLTTGKGSCFEAHSLKSDKMFALDETVRYLASFSPREVVVAFLGDTKNQINQLKLDQIYQYININPDMVYLAKNKMTHKISYQNEYFGKVFNFDNQLSVIENLQMEFNKWSRLALLNLLCYAETHQTSLIKFLKKPEPFTSEQFLHLGNNALHQLNVLESEKHLNYDNQIKSLFDVVNFTSTCLGKRYLKKSLSSPLVSIDMINKRLDAIEYMIADKVPGKIEEDLNSIYDLERLERRWIMNIIHPYQMFNLNQSYQCILNLVTKINPEKYKLLNLSKDKIDKTKKLFKELSEKFIWDKMNNLTLSDIKESFFHSNVSEETDELQKKINHNANFMDKLVDKLESYIDDKKYFKIDKKVTRLINLKFNERDGYYLLLTNRRCSMLKKKLNNKTKIKVTPEHIVKKEELDFIELPRSSNTKIKCPQLNNVSNCLVALQTKIQGLSKRIY